MRYIKRMIQIILLVVCLFAVRCSKTVTSQRVVTPNLDMTLTSISQESYQSVKEKWTVTLGASNSRAPFPMAFGGPSPNGGHGHGGEFPLIVTATFMDAEVIEAGFKHYEHLLSMVPEEADQFRQHYFELHDLEKNVLIEALLQTSWTEVYLDLSRWTIFIEDDLGNQYEPEKITEQLIPSSHLDDMFTESSWNRRSPFSFKMHQKQLFLYFSKEDKYGQSLIHEGIKYLKLVFLQEEGGSSRAEGMWTFNWDNE